MVQDCAKYKKINTALQEKKTGCSPSDKELGQFLGQVGFARAARSAQNNPPMLHEEGNVTLDNRLGNQRLERQGIDSVLIRSWMEIRNDK